MSSKKQKAIDDFEKISKLVRPAEARQPHKFCKGWFITLNEPTADQRSVFAKAKGRIVSVSFDQFRSKLIDALSYLTLRANYPFGSVRDPSTGNPPADLQYVPLDISNQLQCGVLLQSGATCHAQFPSNLHELRTVTKAVSYHGPSGRIRIMKGLSWRYGYVNVQRVTSEQLKELDSGTLLITNKRLLFNGAKRNVSLPLKRVIHFTLFSDTIQIEKDSGKDQYFKGTRDLELIGAVLEVCLRQR